MSDGFKKYAVYWMPKHTDPLAQFGASWTGWCAETGESRSRGVFGDLSVEIPKITRHIRLHGLHGVIKAPFRLGACCSPLSLEHTLGPLVEDSVSFQLPRLRLAVVGGCVALIPSQGSPEISDLADRIGKALAPLDAAVPANSVAEPEPEVVVPVHPSEPDGVPTVDPAIEFPTTVDDRFHMPLTDPIGPELALEVIEKLLPALQPILRQPRQLSDLALMGDPSEGRPLRLQRRYDMRD